MTFSTIQTGFVGGELSPSVWGRVDLKQYRQSSSTCRNFFVNYRGGASSRAGTAQINMCKQGAPNLGGTLTSNPPRDIPFQFNINQGYALEFGDQYMRIKSNGAYVIEGGTNITGATKANPCVLHIVAHGYSVGDWIFIQNMGGMTNFNGLIWIVRTTPDADHITIQDLFGVTVNSTTYTAYTSGGTASRVYTVVSPYAAIDLPYLKYTQSADTMTLDCVNQVTFTEYKPYELQRLAATNWTFTAIDFASVITPPTNVTSTAQSSAAVTTWYSYLVTSVSSSSSEESVASAATAIENNDISVNAGSNTISWDVVSGAGSYNIYKATPAFTNPVPVGVSYGYLGSAFGNSFVDTNITADFTKVPPTHQDPFARGQIVAVMPTAGGATYTQATIGFTITTGTGTGFAGTPVVSVTGTFVAFIITNTGKGYLPGDTITITDSGAGAGATATLTIGAETGTYPSVPAYYQQRRVYANTLNEPDTYFMSQPGLYKNMDASIPTTASDAITGTPWAQQINGIQFMIPMPAGLVIFTGNGSWLLNGGNNSAITPADQTAIAQSYIGCSALVPPIVANNYILYVQAKNSVVRNIAYDFYNNIYKGDDLTILSNHLFLGRTILQWAYCEEPYKIIWAIRDDGVMLSLTYLREQEVYGWARHDTDGLFIGACSVIEPPVDALYLIVKRYINGSWVYYSERMNNRIWQNLEDCWCVDSGLSYPMSTPSATLTAAAATGTNNITSSALAFGGSGYTSPTITAIDPFGVGTGATFSATLAGGVITAIHVLTGGQNYSQGTSLQISDPTGVGAVAQAVVTNFVHYTTSSAVFNSGMVGDVIRSGGGIATIVTYVSPTEVIANITQPITFVLQDDLVPTPIPVNSGNWTLSTPTTLVSGLNHLAGKTVSIYADGSVFPQQVVSSTGSITLPHACSSILVGLPFIAQLQTLYLDINSPTTIQGKRKNIPSVVVRLEESKGVEVGTNQPDASIQPNGANVPWTNMVEIKERNATVQAGSPIPLFTGDEFTLVEGDWELQGQVAVQQLNPTPANILAVISFCDIGDTDG